MKSKLTILAITVACLSQGAAQVKSQQPYAGGPVPYAAMPPGAAPMAPAHFGGAHGPAPMGPAYAAPAYAAPAMPAPGYGPGGGYPVPGAVPPVTQATAIEGQPFAAPQMWAGQAAWEGEGCTSCDAETACDSCDSCGAPECDCLCGGGLFEDLFGCHGCSWFSKSGVPRPVRVYGGVEGLVWWNKKRTLPILATTSSAGTPYNQAGVLGQPNTSTLFGGGDLDDSDPDYGIRGTLGIWFDSHQTIGVLARGFNYGEKEIDFVAASPGDTILARPFYDISAGVENALVVAYPGISRGRINVDTSLESTGVDVMMRKLLYYGNCNRLDFVGGYHTTRVDDSVRVSHVLVSQDPGGLVPVGTQISTVDVFRAENEFQGGSIGLLAEGYDGRLTWNLLTKVSFGNQNEMVSINGASTTAIPAGGGVANFDQGLLALDSNSGVYERDTFAIVPELDLSVMYHITHNVQLSVGYSAIFWSKAVLAGDAIDTTINPTQITGPLVGAARPVYSWQDDSFWLHGLTFGVHGNF